MARRLTPEKIPLRRRQLPRPAPDNGQLNPLEEIAHRLLIDTAGYPRGWLGTRITFTSNDTSVAGIGMLTARILTQLGDPFLICCVCEPRGTHAALDWLTRHLLQSDTAGLGVVTDGSKSGTRYLQRRFDRATCENAAGLETYRSTTKEKRKAPQPLTDRLEGVLFEAHSHIRDIDGLHAGDSLDELCKFLCAKLFDERTVGSFGREMLHSTRCGSTEELAATARGLYRQAAAHADPGAPFEPIRLSSAALARVTLQFQDMSLLRSDVDLKGRAFQRVITPALRAGMGQYFTPLPVVRFMVAAMEPTDGERMLDPFCGSGRFLLESMNRRHRDPSGENAEIERPFKKEKKRRDQRLPIRAWGIEKSERMVRVAMTDLQLLGGAGCRIQCADSLVNFTNLAHLEAESFDIVLTNPPFGSLLRGDAVSRLGKFELAAGRPAVPLEVLGLERCLQFLRPGGRLAIVLPDGLLANRGTAFVRDWTLGQAKLRAVFSLPMETFSPFGANIKTSVVLLRKWRDGEAKERGYSVFLARIDRIGYDATGRSRGTSELDAVLRRFRSFIKGEGW